MATRRVDARLLLFVSLLILPLLVFALGRVEAGYQTEANGLAAEITAAEMVGSRGHHHRQP